MRTCTAISVLAWASFCAASVLQGQGVNISSGGATYTWDPASPQTATFVDPIAGNILFEDHWILRYFDPLVKNGQTFTLSLDGTTDPQQLDYQGTTNFGDHAVSNWNVNGTSGVGQAVLLYQVEITHTIYTVNGRAALDYQATVTNVAGPEGSDFDLFNFFDYDIDPFGTNSAQTLVKGSDIRINMQGDAADTFRTSFGADLHELRAVGVGPRITSDILNVPGYDLDNDPTILTNVDVNAAVQWEEMMPAVGNSNSYSGTTGIVVDVAVAPEGMKLNDGVVAAGTIQDLFASDDQYLELDPSPTKNLLKQKVHLIVQATSPTDTPSAFEFRLESAMMGGPSGDVIQTIELLNYQTGALELLDTRAVANVDESVVVTPAGDLSRFVQPITSEITAEITWKSESFSGAMFTWSLDVDEAVWLVSD